MFGSKDKSKDSGKNIIPAAATHSLNSLVQGTHVEGKIKAASDIRVDGTIKGDLDCESKVIIGPTGGMEGTIRCNNAVIEGKFEGHLHVKELLNIRETAKVVGEVTYGKLVVQSGAIINGTYNMVGQQSNGVSKSPDKVVTTSSKSSSAEDAGEKARQLAKEAVH
ncbi:MAG: polymer-forming cytoskeletal protein [Saprospiraceae bacterium]|nr:MAG: polymer-forming cytoskeletal protein [Saprospiraceae bacterium]